MAELQSWYQNKVGKTWSHRSVQVVKGLENTAYYTQQPYNWGRILDDLATQRNAGLVDFPDSCSPPYNVAVIFVHHESLGVFNGGTPCGGIAGPGGATGYPAESGWYAGDGGGLSMYSEHSMNTFMGLEPDNWWENAGWIAHEIGHGFTLPHPMQCMLDSSTPYCATALMWSQWTYPDATLLDIPEAPEISTLQNHPLFDIVR